MVHLISLKKKANFDLTLNMCVFYKLYIVLYNIIKYEKDRCFKLII